MATAYSARVAKSSRSRRKASSYSASKFALEGYTESRRLEVGSFNIRVSLVEPGYFRTDLHRSLTAGASVLADYTALRSTVEASIKRAIREGDDPANVAEVIVRAAETESPRLRYRVRNDAVWVPRLKPVLPESWFFGGMKRRLKLP